MDSHLLSLPREVRDMISGIVIVNNQPFRIRPKTSQITTSSPTGLPQVCRQISAEYSSLLRKAAFTPGTKTVAPVYDFDFHEMKDFISTLKSHEIKAANKNRNLQVNLLIFQVEREQAMKLMEWLKFTEACGIEVTYVVQWSAVDVSGFKSMEAALGGLREGKKILKALKEKAKM